MRHADFMAFLPFKNPATLNRLLKNSLWAGQAYNHSRSAIMTHTFQSASLVASARFSAAC